MHACGRALMRVCLSVRFMCVCVRAHASVPVRREWMRGCSFVSDCV